MNETAKNIFIKECENMISHMESFNLNHPLILEISKITDVNNIRAVFLNMKNFLSDSSLPQSPSKNSNLPAVIFHLPLVQSFVQEQLEHDVTSEDVEEMSKLYFEACESVSEKED